MPEERPREEQKKRTVFALYIPGGGILGAMPMAVLDRLEHLLGKPAIEAFQVTEGASIGGLGVAAMNIRDPQNPAKPKFSSRQIYKLICEHAQNFFPEMPNRRLKMTTAVSASLLQSMIDPLKPAAFVLRDINELVDKIKKAAPEKEHAVLDQIRDLSSRKWYTKWSQKKASRLCDELGKRNPQLAEMTGDLFAHVSTRHVNTPLDIIFKSAVYQGAEAAKTMAGEFRFDPGVPQKLYQELFGDARLSDCIRTLYISANSRAEKEIKTFSCLKPDLFSLDPAAPSSVSEGNHKMWDLTMATTANPIGYPPHITEDGIECDDRAHRHMPLLHYINDIVQHKPQDADLKLIIIGTGWYVSKDIDKEKQYTAYAQNPLGDLGYFLEEDNAYTTSLQRKILHESLGKDNVIEINPRMSPRNQKELVEFPERDILNASPENIVKVKWRARNFIREEDARIKGLARMLADNLHNIGQMNDDEYEQALKRIGSEYELPEPEKVCNNSCRKIHPVGGVSSQPKSASPLSWLFRKAAREQDNLKEDPPKKPGKSCNGGPRCEL